MGGARSTRAMYDLVGSGRCGASALRPGAPLDAAAATSPAVAPIVLLRSRATVREGRTLARGCGTPIASRPRPPGTCDSVPGAQVLCLDEHTSRTRTRTP